MTTNEYFSSDNLPLGKTVQYPDQYDANLLCSIQRSIKRVELGITTPIFFGADLWTAYEFSWLNYKGKPQIALLHLVIPADSPNIIESKSLKLYLNSFNHTRFEGDDQGFNHVNMRLNQDLSVLIGSKLSIVLEMFPLSYESDNAPKIAYFQGVSLDRLDIECTHYLPNPNLLNTYNQNFIEESVYSDLLKSNCLITGQPDWGSVWINYLGKPIIHEGLLQYIISLRNHNEFHEQCVERMFMDIWQRCQPIRLTVYARYTRRGGIDINPYRSSISGILPNNIRLVRQ